MTPQELAEIEAQLDESVPYYLPRLIQALRAAWDRAERAERALANAQRTKE